MLREVCRSDAHKGSIIGTLTWMLNSLSELEPCIKPITYTDMSPNQTQSVTNIAIKNQIISTALKIGL